MSNEIVRYGYLEVPQTDTVTHTVYAETEQQQNVVYTSEQATPPQFVEVALGALIVHSLFIDGGASLTANAASPLGANVDPKSFEEAVNAIAATNASGPKKRR